MAYFGSNFFLQLCHTTYLSVKELNDIDHSIVSRWLKNNGKRTEIKQKNNIMIFVLIEYVPAGDHVPIVGHSLCALPDADTK